MVVVTVLVAVSITATLRLNGDVGAAAVGRDRHTVGNAPSGMVAVTVFVAVSITDTLAELGLVT